MSVAGFAIVVGGRSVDVARQSSANGFGRCRCSRGDVGGAGGADGGGVGPAPSPTTALPAGNGRFAYTTSTGSGTVSGYRLSGNGDLTLLGNGISANVGAGSAPILPLAYW